MKQILVYLIVFIKNITYRYVLVMNMIQFRGGSHGHPGHVCSLLIYLKKN